MNESTLLTRRHLLLCGGAAVVATALPATPSFALNAGSAKALVDKVVAEINAIIGSGQSEAKMIGRFEKLFARYANVPAIAQQVLGPPARSLSAKQKA